MEESRNSASLVSLSLYLCLCLFIPLTHTCTWKFLINTVDQCDSPILFLMPFNICPSMALTVYLFKKFYKVKNVIYLL